MMAKSCEFGDLTESLIRDRIICGIDGDALRARLLRVQDLDLQKAITICRAVGSTNEALKELTGQYQENVHFVNKSKLRKIEMVGKNLKIL